MNDRHRRIARLKRKKRQHGLFEFIPPVFPINPFLVHSQSRKEDDYDALRYAVEQMCRSGKVELKDFEKLKEVAE